MWDTRGPRGRAALRPLVLLGQARQCPTSTRFRRQTNEQTYGHHHHINPSFCGRAL